MRHLAILALLPAAASGLTVGQLPPSPFADTEASTNVSVSVDFAKMTRMEFSLSLDASPTNCVEVAVGTDADGDGVLSPFEAAHTFGYRCGAWFARDALADAGEVALVEGKTPGFALEVR